MAAVDATVGGQRDHHERRARVDGGLEWLQVVVVAGGPAVRDRRRDIGVARHPAESREVLDGRVDARLPHAGDERLDVAGHDRGRVPELALELTDGGVLGGVGGRHDIRDRCEVEVDARMAQVITPGSCALLQHRGVQGTLGERARDIREAGAVECLYQAALLVRRDEEAHLAGGGRGRQGLDGVRDDAGRTDPGVRLRAEGDRAEVIRLQGCALGAAERGTDTDHEQLTDALGTTQGMQRLGRARGCRGPGAGGSRHAGGSCQWDRGREGPAARHQQRQGRRQRRDTPSW